MKVIIGTSTNSGNTNGLVCKDGKIAWMDNLAFKWFSRRRKRDLN